MAVSFAIDPALLSLRNGDRPVMIPRNVIVDAGTVIANQTARFTSPDQSNASYPAINLYDLTRRTQWRSGVSALTMYILVDAGVGKQLTASCLIVEGDDGLYAGRTVSVRVGDTLDGTGRITVPFVLSPTSFVGPATRAVDLWDREYRGRYWEIGITAGVANIMRLRQCWLGLQKFLPHNSRVPYDEDERYGSSTDVRATSGGRTRIEWFRGLARHKFEFWMNNSEVGINATQQVRDTYDDSDGFHTPIWYIEEPRTAPNTTSSPCFLDEDFLDLPSQLAADKLWTGVFEEDGPHID